jgi:putative CocE/NonD family hydrolase
MKRLRRLVITLFLALYAAQSNSRAESSNATWFAEHYTKHEYRIPMRDGIRLFTRVYIPKDDSQKWPLLLTRTPYAIKPYGSDNYTDPSGSFWTLATNLFIMVSQDVRGRYGSEGEFVNVRPLRSSKDPKAIDESTDTWDTIDWLVKHVPGNNGKAGIFGISYPGFYAAMGMIDSHPALKCASPQAPISDWFAGDDIYHNGALFLSQNFGFAYWFWQKLEDPLHEEARNFNFKTPDGYDYFLRMGPLSNSTKVLPKGTAPEWTEFLEHDTYDKYWQERSLRPRLKNIHCAVMTVGGWFDAEDLSGSLEVYRNTERLNPGITNLLVMGPWSHGGWGHGSGDQLGPVHFHASTAEFYREKIELPFFRHFLKDDINYTTHEAQVFETGENRWRQFDEWPPKQCQTRSFYFHADGKLSFDPPAEQAEVFDEYISDPAKPVPYSLEPSTGYAHAYPVEDQRFAAARPDVVVYETDPLEEDLVFAGALKADLRVSTTGTDSDWVVKLIDVYPGDFPNPNPNPTNVKLGGYQQLVRGDVFRGKFRNGFEKAEPFEPGKLAKVEFTLPDICHSFRRGHRVMVQLQSSWFPLVDRNPQKFVNIPTARAEDFQKATQRIYRMSSAPSSLVVNVLPPEKP